MIDLVCSECNSKLKFYMTQTGDEISFKVHSCSTCFDKQRQMIGVLEDDLNHVASIFRGANRHLTELAKCM